MLRRAHAVGVRAVISAGYDATRPEADMVESPVEVWRTVGIHPLAVSPREVGISVAWLNERLKVGDVVAIGEVGLDRRAPREQWSGQEELLFAQIELAIHYRLPIILHCVQAIGRLMAMLTDIGPRLPAVMWHAYSGSAELVDSLADLGCYFSFGGLATYTRSTRIHRAVRAVPWSRLLVESGTPDHPPVGVSTPSEPAHVRSVVQSLASLRNESPDLVATAVVDNALRLFGREPPPS